MRSGRGRLMLHEPTAARWGAQPQFRQSLESWRWCADAFSELLSTLASALPVVPTTDRGALARAFWQWAATLDSEAHLEAVEPVDHAHFLVGMLLSQWLWQRPLRLAATPMAEEIGVYTDAALTVLAAWRAVLGAEPMAVTLPERSSARWASYLENVTEDPTVAVAYLDLFTGREPVWRFPTFPAERPPIRQALMERRRIDPG